MSAKEGHQTSGGLSWLYAAPGLNRRGSQSNNRIAIGALICVKELPTELLDEILRGCQIGKAPAVEHLSLFKNCMSVMWLNMS